MNSIPELTTGPLGHLTCEILFSKLYDGEDHGVCQLFGQLCVENIQLKERELY